MPKNWFFDIHEDTPEEEAANLMEHSTLTLDLSSDEQSSKKANDDRGKENMPPEDYDAPTASRPAAEPAVAAPKQVKKADIIRKKIIKIDDMDDDQRSPLSDLETDEFIPEGLDRASHIIVDPTPAKTSSTSSLEVSTLFAAPVPFTAGSGEESSKTASSKSLYDAPVLNAEGDVKGDIIVWEDSPVSEQPSSPLADKAEAAECTKFEVTDENSQPLVDHVE